MDPFGKSNFIFQPLIFRGVVNQEIFPKARGAKFFQRSNPRPLDMDIFEIVRGWITMQWLLHVSAWKQYSLLHFSVPYLKDPPTKIHLLQRLVLFGQFLPRYLFYAAQEVQLDIQITKKNMYNFFPKALSWCFLLTPVADAPNLS